MVEGRAVAGALMFRASLPPHPALSLGERENRPPRFGKSSASRLVAVRDAVFPLPLAGGAGGCFAGVERLLAALSPIVRIHQ